VRSANYPDPFRVSKTLVLVKNDIKQQWLSSSTYVAGVVFLMPMILFYWVIIKDYSEATHHELMVVAFYRVFWIPNLFVIPLLTMKSIAEERRLGTLETLMTTPITSMQLVLSKFVAAYSSYGVFWLMTMAFLPLTERLIPQENFGAPLWEPWALIGAVGFILLSGACFVSIGILSSCLTRSQLVAGMLTFTGVFIVMISGRLFAEIPMNWSTVLLDVVSVVNYMQTFQHYELFARGILDLRPFVYYISASIGLLTLASYLVERRS
jgi:ABC-2 type transport system permease protein